jgi:hypothetical protein
MIINFLQTLITSSAILLGFTYVIGGLVVNLNLARRGVVEFQILKVKYLVVGLVFLLHSVGVFVFAALPAFGLLYFSNQVIVMQLLNLISMMAAIFLILIWIRQPSGSQSFLTTWTYWFVTSAIGASFPMLVFIRQIMAPSTELTWIIISAQAILTAALTFLAQIYHYAAFYYGRPSSLGALDPIGVGIPPKVRVACQNETATLLKNLGVEIGEDQITQVLFLIDETDKHYILAFERLPGRKGENRTIKVDKDIIKAILFIPEHTERIKGERPN